MSRNLLLTPGPTKIPPFLCEALGRPIIHHRTPQFQQILKNVTEGLQYVFQTKEDVYLLASSGTGGLEAAVINLLSPGDKAICVQGGKFGERWTELCQQYQMDPIVVDVPWGEAVDPNVIEELMASNKDVKAVFTTLCETSTGVATDIEAIAKIVSKTDAVLAVDAVSGLGVQDCQMDNWGVDVVVSASHKGFMLPPGVGFIAVSPKAAKAIELSTTPKYYFDLKKSKKAWESTDTPYTPAIGIIVALEDSLNYFKEKGLSNLLERYAYLANATREAAKALGLTLFPKESCIANNLTAINMPENVDGGKVVKTMRDVHGISIAGGQAQLKGKIIRIAHMGCVDEEDLITGFTYLEKVLEECGHSFTANASIEALKKEFNGHIAA